jgi:hypothetical protein
MQVKPEEITMVGRQAFHQDMPNGEQDRLNLGHFPSKEQFPVMSSFIIQIIKTLLTIPQKEQLKEQFAWREIFKSFTWIPGVGRTQDTTFLY